MQLERKTACGIAVACSVAVAACGGFSGDGRTDGGDGAAQCGNGRREVGELCDGDDVGAVRCADFNFTSGTLRCAADCARYSFAQCQGDDGGAMCGNGVKEAGEACDRADLDGRMCSDVGFERGTLACARDCSEFDTRRCTNACTPDCDGRACGPDPACGTSCGMCATGACNADGQCEEPPPGGPRILTFNSNVTEITQGESVTLSAVVTDPDGIDDLIGGTLNDPVTGRTYDAFATSASEGAYSLDLSWADIHTVRPIDFLTEEARTFRADFYDEAGNRASAEVAIMLTCDGDAACDGVCTDVTTAANCGMCGRECARGASCVDANCRCPEGFGVCDDVCVDLSDAAHCGRCDNECTPGAACVEGRCVCEAGLTPCEDGCRSAIGIDTCGPSCASCEAAETCSRGACRGAVEGDVRATAMTGVLEVFHENEWRGICDDGFTELDGQVVCRQLGGSYASLRTNVGGSGRFWLDGVGCSGEEPSVSQCNHADWGVHDCGATEHVAVLCDVAEVVDPGCTPLAPGVVSINEVLFDPTGADGSGASEFVELRGPAGQSLEGVRVVGVDGGTGQGYLEWPLQGTVPANGLVVAGGGNVAGVTLVHTGPLQNGPDSVQVLDCAGGVLDAVGYGTFTNAANNRGEGTAVPRPPEGRSIGRRADGTDSGDNAADFAAQTPSPGASNE